MPTASLQMTSSPKKRPRTPRVVITDAFRDYKKSMDRYSFSKVHDRERREDMVQETFTKTWVYLVKGGKIDIMRAFLFHALNCVIIDDYRKHKPTSLDVLLEGGFEPASTDDSERLINMLDGKSAYILLNQLPEKYQQVLRMRYSEHLSLTEMALKTGSSRNTLAVQVHRGLEKLKILYDRKPPSSP